MVDDIRGDTGGDFERLLASLANANRDESDDVDGDLAETDADTLIEVKINGIVLTFLSVTVRHPLILLIAFAINQHQGSYVVCYITACQPGANNSVKLNDLDLLCFHRAG